MPDVCERAANVGAQRERNGDSGRKIFILLAKYCLTGDF